MPILFWILLTTILDGVIAFVGALTLVMKRKTLKKVLFFLVGFSAGALIGGAFFHVITESLEEGMEPLKVFSIVIFGFMLFFVFEKYLYWHHCHKEKCPVHPYTYLILLGDSIHNFVDGLIIAGAFLVDINFGIITAFMIIAHEIPQELGDFAVLVRGGLKVKKALFYNFLSQLTAVVGGVVGFYLGSSVEAFVPVILPFAAGGFIYIGASDLIPQLHESGKIKDSVFSFILFACGILLMLGLKLFLE